MMEGLNSHRTVFLAGNFEAQRIAGCFQNNRVEQQKAIVLTIKKHFIFSCLISDFVIQPVAHYHQSKITQWLTKKYKLFFQPYKSFPQIALYAVSYRKGTFFDDAAEKAETYTSNFKCYKDKETRSFLTNQLSSLTEPFIRKGQLANSLSNIILDTSNEEGDLYKFLFKLTDDRDATKKILYPLREISKEQKMALIPEYLQQKIKTKTPQSFLRLMRLSLLDTYTKIAGGLYDAYPHNALYPFYIELHFPYKLHHLDTHLFHYFIRIIPGLDEIITNSDPSKILELKYSDRFMLFLEYYRSFIESLMGSSMQNFRMLALNDYEKQKNIYHKKLYDFLNTPSLLFLLHNSMGETINSRTLPSSCNFFSYQNIPIFSLVSEVMERFTGKYEGLLKSVLKKSEYTVLEKKKLRSSLSPSQVVNNSVICGDLKLVQNFFSSTSSVNFEIKESTQNISESKAGGKIIQKSTTEKSSQTMSKIDAASDIKQEIGIKGD